MTRKTLFLTILSGWLATCCASHKAQDTAADQSPRHIGDSLQLRTFVMDAHYMFPLRGAAQGLTGGYAVQIRGNQMRSILPYRGRAFRSSMDLQKYGPLHFDAPITGYTVKDIRKGEWQVDLDALGGEEQFHYTFRISPQGKASLKVSSTDRDWIVFEGYIRQ